MVHYYYMGDLNYTTLYTRCPFYLVFRKTVSSRIVRNRTCRRTMTRLEPFEKKKQKKNSSKYIAWMFMNKLYPLCVTFDNFLYPHMFTLNISRKLYAYQTTKVTFKDFLTFITIINMRLGEFTLHIIICLLQ